MSTSHKDETVSDGADTAHIMFATFRNKDVPSWKPIQEAHEVNIIKFYGSNLLDYITSLALSVAASC